MPEEQTRPPQGEEAEAERGPRCSKTLEKESSWERSRNKWEGRKSRLK